MQNVSVHAGVLSTLLCLCLIFWERDLVDLNTWALSVTSVIAGFLVLILLSVSLQPTSSKHLYFKVYASQGTWLLLNHVTNENTVESWNFMELTLNNIMSHMQQKNSFLISVYENVLTHENTLIEPGCLKLESGVSNMWPIIHFIQSFLILLQS